MTVEALQHTARRSRGRPSVEGVAQIDGEILRVALEQFIKHGYGISMSRIVKAAGISKNTMYSRFSSKEELFRALIRRQIDRVEETMPLGSPEAYYDLERGFKNYANRTLEVSLERDFIEVNRLIYSEARRFPELGRAAAERNQIGIAQLADFIRSRAEIDRIPCSNPNTIAEVLILLMRGWYMNATLLDAKVSVIVRKKWVDRAVKTIISSRDEW
jgi:TetR/AcrR family transcriptional regulator, mexJK operon transcriptional repressor